MDELNKLIPDPKWSDCIFWGNDYLNPDDTVNYDKFFEKVSEYEHSEEYKNRKCIVSLVNNLLQKNFQEKAEIQIINKLNQLLQGTDCMECVFVGKLCIEMKQTYLMENVFNMAWD